MKLTKLGEKTFIIENSVNIGIYLLNDIDVCVIDTGSSIDYGKVIDNILLDHNWNLKYIINTHSHADHISGNKYLQDKYHCKILASKIESQFINNPSLEPSLIYGAAPLKYLYNTRIYAPNSECENIEDYFINGIEIINLEGHMPGLIGVVTSDDVCFVGDAYMGIHIIEKYKIQYMFDIEKALNTMDYLNNTNYSYYVPSHGNIEKNIKNTILINKKTILDNANNYFKIIENRILYDDLLKKVFDLYHININIMQYYLISANLKAHLTRFLNMGMIEFEFIDNKLYIKKIINENN